MPMGRSYSFSTIQNIKWNEVRYLQHSCSVSTVPRKRKTGKKGEVRFLLDRDRQPWTWVMGEHQDDKPIEEILEAEAQSKAQKLAEEEALRKQEQEEEEAKRSLKEAEEKLAAEIKRKEEENRKKAEEAALYQSLKEARLMQEKLEEEKRKEQEASLKRLKQIKKEQEQRKRSSIMEIEQMRQKRESELYNSFKLERKRISILAQQQSVELDEEWKQQEERVKAADRERRELARRARQESRASLRDTVKLQSEIIGKAMVGYKKIQARHAKENHPPGKPSVRPAKPPDRTAIVEWFKELERPRGAGLDPSTEQVADWFYGIISRQEAEDLLDAKPVGSFLVRVSERIWGYAISYKNINRSQHFLIDTADGQYQFFGTNQIKHPSLAELIVYHKNRPITSSGKEMLKYPCRHSKDPASCKELFDDCDPETTTL